MKAVSTIQMKAVKSGETDVFLKMALEHFRGLNPNFAPQKDWKKNYFKSIQANKNMYLRWISYNGKYVGFIIFGVENHRFLPRRTGIIYELYVTPHFRKKGIGSKCAAIAIGRLGARHVSKIQLEVVRHNRKAAAFWKKLGFLKVSERFVLTRD